MRTIYYDGVLPTKGSEGAAAYDLRCKEEFTIKKNKRIKVKTGLNLSIPSDLVGLVCPRSGLAYKYGITVLNSTGIIDPDYRGDVSVILHNTGDDDIKFNAGDRIAQLLLVSIPVINFIHSEDIHKDNTERGSKGFGHTGVH